MEDVALAIIRNKDRYLLAQHSMSGVASGTWCLPGEKIDTPYVSRRSTAVKAIKDDLGLYVNSLKELGIIHVGNQAVHVFLCNDWSGHPYPANKNVVGLGWFTIPEMYELIKSLSEILIEILPQLTFLIRHHHEYRDNRRFGGGGYV